MKRRTFVTAAATSLAATSLATPAYATSKRLLVHVPIDAGPVRLR
ncbi:hypothetical protein AB0D57_15875 [Streptomyces sp. NPDC048275]